MGNPLWLFGFSNKRPTLAFEDFMRDVQVPGNDLSTIDASLQARFFQKGPGGEPLERWELKEMELSCPPERFYRHLQLCGFALETIPRMWQYKRAAWPGALLPRVALRLQDLVTAWKSGVRWEETIVFGGKRPLQNDRENHLAAQDVLPKLLIHSTHPDWTPWIKVETELEMMRWLWQNCALPEDLKAIPVVFVDAPMKPSAVPGGSPVRPNTEDTIREWLKSNPSSGSLLLSSGAPYGMAQEIAFRMLVGERGILVDTFGQAAPNLPAEVFMREVAGAVHRIRQFWGT